MVSTADISGADNRLSGFIHRTPLLRSQYFDKISSAELYFKAENFQKTGSFKARGALNSVLKLTPQEASKGVATHSSGNHGQALAWAAGQKGIKAYIVMPEDAPKVKVAAVKEYGAEVIFCEPTLQAREDTLDEVMQKHGAHFVPPYNFINTIEGQATCALEIFDEIGEPDFLMAPVGGGGLLSGSSLSAKYFSPKTSIIGCEPELADDAYQSLKIGERQPARPPKTIADGLRTSLGDITFGIIKQHVSDILLCSEEEIVNTQKQIWERMKIIVEPSCAVPLACLLKNKERFAGKKVAIILSGGNVDLQKLPF